MVQAEERKLRDILARRVKERRKSLGLTQEQLADRAGLTINFVGRLEIGERSPSFATLVRLAKALGVDASYLLSEHGDAEASDVCRYLEHSLGLLSESDSAFVITQFRDWIDHLVTKRKRGGERRVED